MSSSARSLLLLFLAATAHSLNIPAGRRTVAQGAVAATVGCLAGVLPVSAEDPLAAKLLQVRSQLEAAKGELTLGNVDRVRLAVKDVSTPLTLKGYLGDSVKARAISTGSEGLAAERATLLRSLGAIDKYCYEEQMKRSTEIMRSEAMKSLDESLASLDTIVKLL